jgi:hypothetical protein
MKTPIADIDSDLDHDGFAAALTELSERFGIGIAGEPTLYILEPEDRQYRYTVNRRAT